MKYLHASHRYHGPEVTFQPRVPRGVALDEDTTTPRICVAATVEQCLMGVSAIKCAEVMHIYQAVRPKGIDWDGPRRGVPDWEETEEIWIRRECKFKYLYSVLVKWNGDWVVTYRKYKQPDLTPST